MNVIMIDNKISSLIISNHEMSIFTKSDLVRLYAENYKQINKGSDANYSIRGR
jgi:hypothetical protein